MKGDEVDLNDFLEELVESVSRKLKEQDEEIRRLKKEIASLRSWMKRGGRPPINKSILRVLKGK